MKPLPNAQNAPSHSLWTDRRNPTSIVLVVESRDAPHGVHQEVCLLRQHLTFRRDGDFIVIKFVPLSPAPAVRHVVSAIKPADVNDDGLKVKRALLLHLSCDGNGLSAGSVERYFAIGDDRGRGGGRRSGRR